MTRRQPPTLVFAAGSASNAPDPMLTTLVPLFEAQGMVVVPVTLPANTAENTQLSAFADAASKVRGRYVVGGFSLGARLAARLCADVTRASAPARAPVGLLAFGYPFHSLTTPPSYAGRDALCATTLPVHIVQGARDKHGTEAQVRGYDLPSTVAITWLPDANHRLAPRAKSGWRAEDLLRTAALAASRFLERL